MHFQECLTDLNFVVENSYQKQIIIQRRVFLERIFKLIA